MHAVTYDVMIYWVHQVCRILTHEMTNLCGQIPSHHSNQLEEGYQDNIHAHAQHRKMLYAPGCDISTNLYGPYYDNVHILRSRMMPN